MSMTRLFFFLIMIVAMTGFGCGGGSGSGGGPSGGDPVAGGLPFDRIATQAPEAAQSTPAPGSVTQTSNTENGITVDRISSTPSYNQGSLRATVRNGATTLGPSDIVPHPFDLSRGQWQQVSFEKEDSNGTIYSIVLSDIENNNDTDYLSGGIWVYVPKEAADSANLDDVVFGTFAGGNTPFPANLRGVTGEATYQGDAIGLYLEETPDTPNAAAFNATVVLTANFGTGSDMGTISGTVRNFSTRPGSTSSSTDQPFSFQGTSLNLGQTPIGNTRAGFFTGDTSGSHQGETYSGKWGGEFLGNGASPTSVTGTFGAENGDTSNRRTFMGFFGAYQQ